MQAQVVLTVSESKRLIAKGIAECEPVKAAMADGIVAVAKGTTNSYVAEELLRRKIDKSGYVAGHTVPATLPDDVRAKIGNRLGDVVFRKGQVLEGASIPQIVKDMKRGDVIMKGANAINYSRGLAGVLIGDSTGGTVGAIIGHVVARRLTLLVPVGLEKEVAVGLDEVAGIAADPTDERYLKSCPLWMFPANLYTEIEALETLAGVTALPIAAGGIAGAEGATRLLLTGEDEDVEEALSVVKQVQGEPPFLGA